MGRRKKGRDIHGWLVLDKPFDFGSTEAVSKTKWLFEAKKAGHAGTLDPLATGILPIALGEATKTVSLIQDSHKRYRFTVKWGAATTTDDLEGDVIAQSDYRPDPAAITAGLAHFTGEIAQIPPAFSAVKVKGERAYDLARDGERPALAPRLIQIDSLALLDCPDVDTAILEAVTGKGAYIRALVRDLAEFLGTRGHVTALRRTEVGPFGEDMAVTFEQMTNLPATARIPEETFRAAHFDQFLLPIEEALPDLPKLSLSGPQASRLRHGQAAIITPAAAKGLRVDDMVTDHQDIPILATRDGVPVALCALDGLTLKSSRVFNL